MVYDLLIKTSVPKLVLFRLEKFDGKCLRALRSLYAGVQKGS